MSSLALTTIKTIFATAERLGATMPKAVRDEHAELSALTAQARGLSTRQHPSIGTAVVAALTAGADPATDPGVQQAVVWRSISENVRGVEMVVNDRTTSLLSDHGPAIIAALDKPFATAAETITAGLEHLGDIALDDHQAVTRRGGDAARTWVEADAASKAIEDIRTGWKMLSSVAPSVPWDPRHTLLVIADVPAADYLDAGLGEVKVRMSPWDAARRGWPLSLADPDIYRARIAAVMQERERRSAEIEDAFKNSFRRSHGTAVG